MIAAWLAFIEGIAAVSLFAAGIVAAHFRMTPPIIGFVMSIIAGGLFFGLLGTIFGIVGVIRTRAPQRAHGRSRAVIGLVLSLIALTPIIVQAARGSNHRINDITTDFDQAPEFTNAAKLPENASRDMAYDKAKYADIQQRQYGDLAPLTVDKDVSATFDQVKSVASTMPSWTITFTDPATHTVEGYCTSNLFQFKDDFVIQVRPGPDASKSLVEMRSKSRDGQGDFGVNYHRIVRFFDQMKSAS